MWSKLGWVRPAISSSCPVTSKRKHAGEGFDSAVGTFQVMLHEVGKDGCLWVAHLFSFARLSPIVASGAFLLHLRSPGREADASNHRNVGNVFRI